MMKKRLVVIAAMLGIMAGSVPVTAHASEMNVIHEGDGYVVIAGKGSDCLKEILDKIGVCLGNSNIVCPETPEQPDVEIPVIPETPEQPDVEVPVNPESPVIPEQPDVEIPVIPEIPEQPEDQNPDDNVSEESVHPYATEILNLVNAERAKVGLSALALDMNITAAANVRAKEIKQSFSHTRPDGSSFSTALKEQGVSYRGSGENIAWGQKSPEQVVNGWMNSDGHRANILNKNFTSMGVGYYQDENGVNYWVQLFTY